MRKLTIALSLAVASISGSALAASPAPRPATPAVQASSALSRVLRATADEIREVRGYQTTISAKYVEIGRHRVANLAKGMQIVGVYAQINGLRAQIARLGSVSLQVGMCSIAVKAFDAKTATLNASVARAQREVAQDASELATSNSLYNKQKDLCAAKARNGENASEIASCRRTEAILLAQVTAERADMGRAQIALTAVTAARTAHTAAGAVLSSCRALVANPPSTAAAVASLNSQINAKYAQIATLRAEIASNATKIENLYKEIAELNKKIAAAKAEAAQDAVCALKIKAWDDKAAATSAHVETMLKEVNQDRSELTSTESIYNAQKSLCDRKRANRENASEIASCDSTARTLGTEVAKERVDLVESTRAHTSALAAKAAHQSTSSQLASCRAAVRN